jgi:hypothetical protein
MVDAAWLSVAHGIPGPDPIAATILASKALAYQFLRSRGLPTLPFYVPLSPRDLNIAFSRPIIVKPEHGSGTVSWHPWGYRTFDGIKDFRRYLAAERLERQFFLHQETPHAAVGRYLVMEFVESEWLYGAHLSVGDTGARAYDQFSFTVDKTLMTPIITIYNDRLKGGKSLVAMATEFGRLGFRRALLSIQAVKRHGTLYPIDFNFRPTAMVNRLNEALDTHLYEHALAFLLGRDAHIDFSWPAQYVVSYRMYLRKKKGKYKAEFGADSIPLMTGISYDPKKPYDWGYAWPSFALLCEDKGQIMKRISRVLAATTIRRVD